MVIIGIVVPIVAAVLLGWFFYWRTNRVLIAVFMLVSALPGGDVATRIYEDMRRTGQVRGVPYLTEDGKWSVAWKLPPYEEKTPKP